ncbi:MAG: HNH endonuclease [Pirellulales bacterium]
MIDAATRQLVRDRAGDKCEYCGLPSMQSPLAALQIEHILPRKHRGGDEPGNLALACIDCNLCKGSNIAGIDPTTGATTKLFHPRRHKWDAHFKWLGIYIVGKTPIGRATIEALRMNSDEQLQLRIAQKRV